MVRHDASAVVAPDEVVREAGAEAPHVRHHNGGRSSRARQCPRWVSLGTGSPVVARHALQKTNTVSLGHFTAPRSWSCPGGYPCARRSLREGRWHQARGSALRTLVHAHERTNERHRTALHTTAYSDQPGLGIPAQRQRTRVGRAVQHNTLPRLGSPPLVTRPARLGPARLHSDRWRALHCYAAAACCKHYVHYVEEVVQDESAFRTASPTGRQSCGKPARSLAPLVRSVVVPRRRGTATTTRAARGGADGACGGRRGAARGGVGASGKRLCLALPEEGRQAGEAQAARLDTSSVARVARVATPPGPRRPGEGRGRRGGKGRYLGGYFPDQYPSGRGTRTKRQATQKLGLNWVWGGARLRGYAVRGGGPGGSRLGKASKAV